jgi:hypothetical protein
MNELIRPIHDSPETNPSGYDLNYIYVSKVFPDGAIFVPKWTDRAQVLFQLDYHLITQIGKFLQSPDRFDSILAYAKTKVFISDQEDIQEILIKRLSNLQNRRGNPMKRHEEIFTSIPSDSNTMATVILGLIVKPPRVRVLENLGRLNSIMGTQIESAFPYVLICQADAVALTRQNGSDQDTHNPGSIFLATYISVPVSTKSVILQPHTNIKVAWNNHTPETSQIIDAVWNLAEPVEGLDLDWTAITRQLTSS